MVVSKRAPLPRALWVLFAGVFINRFGSFVTTFLILYMTSRGYSIAQAGLAVGSYGVGGLIASAVGGYLTDYLGRKNTIMLSMFSSAVTMLVLSQVGSLPLFILFTSLTGLTTELYRPALSAMITDLVPQEQRVSAFAWNRLAINLGYTVGPAVAGFLASRSFFLLFVGDALTSITFGLIVLFALPVGTRALSLLPKEAGAAEEAVRPESFWQAVRHDRRFMVFVLASAAISFVYFQSQSTFALQVTALGFTSATFGLLVSLNGLLVVLLGLPVTMITRRFAARPVIIIGYVLIAVGFGLVSRASILPLLILAVAIWTFGEIMHGPMSSAYVAQLAPVRMRGRYQGVYGLSQACGLVLGPSLGSILFAWDASFFWLLCGGIGLLAALLVGVGGGGRRKEDEAGSAHLKEERVPVGLSGERQ